MSSSARREEEKAKPRLQAEIFAECGSSMGSYITEDEDRLIIGSSKRADLVVPHQSVSQIHAMLRVEEKLIRLYDLGSEQGTFVEGKKIVERQLKPGETFEIGGHRVKVSLVDFHAAGIKHERAAFWDCNAEIAPDYLELIRLEDGIVRDERTLGRNSRVVVGRRKSEILFEGIKAGERFLHRRDTSSSHTVEGLVPVGCMAEVFDGKNELVRVIEQGGSSFTFGETEKVRLSSEDGRTEVMIFWRPAGVRTSRRSRDAESPALQRALAGCGLVTAIILAFVSYVPLKTETVEEAIIPKSSYYRLSMDSAPAAAPAAQQDDGGPAQNNQAPAPSKAESISNSLTKLLNKSAVSADAIQQAVSQNGAQTTRVANLRNANVKTEEIGGAVGGGSVNVNAISAGLASGGGGKAGSLKGFAGGKGTAIGTGSGFGGKGFDMSLGGDEAEAIGGLDKSLIAAVVQQNIGQIKHCYERQLIVDPNIFGKIVAQWTINTEGAVSTTSVKSTTMNNKPVENCILAKIKGWNFPKPKGGGQVMVSYPFLFKSLN